MKKLRLWIVLLLLGTSTTLQLCTSEENLGAQKVQFTFVLSSSANTGGRVQSVTPGSLLLSAQNDSDVPVYTLKEIKLLPVGDSYMTEPLEFMPGHYKITDFLLVDDSSKVLFATPKSGSPLAKAVAHPLPYGFTVAKNKVANVEMEVVSMSQQLPEDLGYTSFPVNAVNPLRLSVFTTAGTITNLTTADAYILHGNDTIKKTALAANINLISFKGNVQDNYRLIVFKPGYNPYVKDFFYFELISSLGNLPLKIYLTPASFTMQAFVDDYSTLNSFEFSVQLNSGSIAVNWGDGTSSSGTSHVYAASGSYLITVSGDINQITDFYSFYGKGSMDAINVQGLTGLQDFRFGLTPHSPKVIDLTSNKKLEFIMATNLVQLEHLILPIDAPMNMIDISGPNQLTTAAVDEIINEVYQSVVQHNQQNGHFLLYANWTDASTPLAPHAMIGPPSSAGLTKLRVLRDTYHWSIAPDPM